MRTPRTRFRAETGQAFVLSILFLGVLLAISAAVLDVGAWYRAQRHLQATVDAAALAGAQALPDEPGRATGLAGEYLAKNGGAATSEITVKSRRSAGDSVSVTATRQAPGIFARVLGISTVKVRATATASAGAPDEARWAAPFAVDEQHPLIQCRCWGKETRLEADKLGPGAWHWMNIDGSRGGTGVPTLVEWIRFGFDGYMPLGWYYSMPGGKRSSQVDDALTERIGDELLLPVFRATRGNGANFEYEVVGWVGFHLTGFNIQGAKNTWLDGWFTRVIWEGIWNESGPAGSDFGARAVALVE